jgi:hypothetical protein
MKTAMVKIATTRMMSLEVEPPSPSQLAKQRYMLDDDDDGDRVTTYQLTYLLL